MCNIQSIKLNDGRDFPMVGLGTFRAVDEESFSKAIRAAVEAGYRHFDCAWLYKNEAIIGKVLKECIAESNGALKREDFFLVSKVWNTFHSEAQVEVALNETLKDLQVDYVDLYLIHWPMGFKDGSTEPFPKDENGKTIYSNVNYLETYQAMEKFVKAGKIKSIGVSNFNIKQLQDVLDHCEIKPVNNQIELNPYLQSDELVEFCKKNNIVVSCYGPIGCGQSETSRPDLPTVLENETIVKIAKRYNKSPAQVCIRWSVQRGLVPLPKSVTPTRVAQNVEVFDFVLTEEEMAEIKALDVNYRFYAVESLKDHKYYPF